MTQDGVSRQTANKRGTGNEWLWRMGTAAVILLFVIAWEILPRAGLVPPIILPAFSDVMAALGTLVRGDTFRTHFAITLFEMLAGFFIGVALGLLIGVPLAVFPRFRRLTYGLVIAFQSVPKILLAPLLITWFGYGVESKVALAVVIAFFPVLINSMTGIQSVPENAIRLMESLKASRLERFMKLDLPFAAPAIFAGIKTALTFAVTGAIVAEFIGAAEGLGYLLSVYAFQLRIPTVYALIVVLAVMGSLLYFLVELADRKIVFWRDSTIR